MEISSRLELTPLTPSELQSRPLIVRTPAVTDKSLVYQNQNNSVEE